MSDLIWLSKVQMRRIEPYFPLSHGIERPILGRKAEVGNEPNFQLQSGSEASEFSRGKLG